MARARKVTPMAYAVHQEVAADASARPRRRRLTPNYKLAILAEWELATNPGEKAAILRREGLYSSMLSDWRRQAREGSLVADEGRSEGGRGGPSRAELERLRRENARLKAKLVKAEAIIEVQGKVHALLEELSKSADSDDSET
jgi:transposase-like protein